MKAAGIVRRYAGLMFLSSFGSGLPMGINVLFALARGLTLVEVGTLIAVHSGTSVLLEVPTGSLSDAWGHRRVVLLSFLVSGAGALAMALSFDLAGFLLAVVLSGCARALLSGAGEALLIESLEEASAQDQSLQGLSALSLVNALGLAAGGLVGGILPGSSLVTSSLERVAGGRLSIPMFGAAAVAAASYVLGVLLLPRPRGAQKTSTRRTIVRELPRLIGESSRFVVRSRVVLMMMLAMTLFAFGVCGLEVFRQPRLAQVMGAGEHDTAVFGTIFAGLLVVTGVGAMVLPRSILRLVPPRPAALGVMAAALAAATIVLSAQDGLAGTVVGLAVVSFAQGGIAPVFQVLFNDAVPSERRATLLSLLSLCMQVGVLAGAAVFGSLAEQTGVSRVWLYEGLALFGLVPMFLYINQLTLPRVVRHAPANSTTSGLPIEGSTRTQSADRS